MRLNACKVGIALCGSLLSFSCGPTSALVTDRPSAPKLSTPSASLYSFALTQNNLQGLMRYARAITVKVISGDDWGSGILVRQQGQRYTVLTNEHVLWMGDRFTIQTFDGKQHAARREASGEFGKNDLGLLEFSSSPSAGSYPVAALGCSLDLSAGTPVYAAGFPLPLTEYSSKGFKFTSGAISLIPTKALEGGYQVGYSNYIEKGMSGGPVLNAKGEVIAVNGMHQEPLWGDPYIFQDGSKPKSSLFPVFSRSSWAIPMETAFRTTALAAAHISRQCPVSARVKQAQG
jgi:S1-C subfamily serine protease